ncbi:autophagic serine protease Alp2 [Sphaerosporella brunnea]|uniref:Autophagic serine protease Alp2 n=1 Tax=Sphaerosporella brunnea TaxID=1250544 RepID=A0A5J5FAK6_9PEZI|nr:autophagic serine protease Alp2 [Sphaerosporella brunnea]
MKVTLTAPFLALLSTITVTIASPIFDTTVVDKNAAPLLSSTSSAEHQIPNNYIVVFKKHVDNSKASEHHSWVSDVHASSMRGLKKRSQTPLATSKESSWLDEIEAMVGLKHTYDIPGGLRGYSGAFDESTLAEIRRHPDVAYVEKDSLVYALEEPTTERSAPWGLARISHKKRLNFGNFNKYIHQAKGGEGVDVYVIDTGTNYEHVDFEGRAHWGKTVPAGDADEDGNGHGTHCSGTIGGKKYGVAKKANIYAVKVLRSNGSGTMSDVVKGVEWAAEAHLKKAAKKDPNFKGSAANMSLGGGKSPSLDMAVNAAVEVGINFAVAAGNDNADACNYSPAAAEKAVTVGASTLGDQRAYFSNYGKCTDIFAPGLNIESTWIGSKYAINTISGTSMASPHVAGLLAYFLSLQPKSDSGFFSALKPAQLKKNMIAIGSRDVLSDIPADTPNLLIYNGGGSDNLTEIFDGEPYVHKPDAEDAKGSDEISILADKAVHEIEAVLEKFEDKIAKEIKAALGH